MSEFQNGGEGRHQKIWTALRPPDSELNFENQISAIRPLKQASPKSNSRRLISVLSWQPSDIVKPATLLHQPLGIGYCSS